MKKYLNTVIFFIFSYLLSIGQVMVTVEELSTFPDNVQRPVPTYKSIDHKIYFFGGLYNSKSYQCSEKIRFYDILSNEWNELPFNLPYGLFDYISASFYSNHFYIPPCFASGNSNGWGSHRKLIDVNLSNSIASETVIFSTGSIWDIANIEMDGTIFFIGGHSGYDHNEIWKYDIETGNMPVVANLLFARNNPALIEGNDGLLYILGDHSQSKPIERFNPSTYNVEQMNGDIPITGIYFYWHISSESTIYFFTHNTLNAELFKYNYFLDIVESTGYFINQPFFGMSILDQDAENIIYALKPDDNSFFPFTLCKLTLENYTQLDKNQNNDISLVFSNPFSMKTTIKFPNPNHSNYKLSVFSISGNKVFEQDNIKTDKIEFERGNLPKGIYLIELKGEKVFRGKMVVR